MWFSTFKKLEYVFYLFIYYAEGFDDFWSGDATSRLDYGKYAKFKIRLLENYPTDLSIKRIDL